MHHNSHQIAPNSSTDMNKENKEKTSNASHIKQNISSDS